MKNLLCLFVTFLLVFALPSKVSAMSIVVSDLPGTVDQAADAEANISLICSGCGDSYMRGVFFPGGTNYFGLTQNNGGEWIGSDSDRSKYFKIAKTDLVEASWSGKLKIKIDTSDSAYLGPGEYLFKVGRYTSPTDASADWSNELTIRITGPTPIPSPSPTQNPTIVPTPSPTPVKTPTPTKTPTLKPTPTPEILGEASGSGFMESISGLENSPNPTPDIDTNGAEGKFPFIAIIFVASGIILVGTAGYMAYRKQKQESPDILNE